jgi:hypothetical protein
MRNDNVSKQHVSTELPEISREADRYKATEQNLSWQARSGIAAQKTLLHL